MSKLEKFEKLVKVLDEFSLSKFMLITSWSVLFLWGLMKDLNLENAFLVCGFAFLLIILFYLAYFVCDIVLACIKRHKAKKTNIEKLIDEELKKGE